MRQESYSAKEGFIAEIPIVNGYFPVTMAFANSSGRSVKGSIGSFACRKAHQAVKILHGEP